MAGVELPGWYVEDPEAERPDAVVAEAEARRLRRARRAGARRLVATTWVVVVGVAALVNIASLTVPGIVFLPGMISTSFLLAAGVVCAIDLAVYLFRRLGDPPPPFPFRLVCIAAMSMLVLVSWFTPLPVRARFELSRAAFDDYAEQVLADTDGMGPIDPWDASQGSAGYDAANPPAPTRLGTFGIRDVRIVPEGLLIFDSEGAFLDDAGFAYLPDGRFPAGNGSFESPEFRSLGGGWYAFTSSW